MKFMFRRRPSDRRLGDRHRDAAEWPAAAQAYRRHLARQPDDGAIHVQLGHALKEQGRLGEAVDAYRAAYASEDQRVDALTHLADTLTRLGRDDEALDTYYRLHAMTNDPDVWQHVVRLRKRPGAARPVEVAADAVFFTIQDLFIYLKAHVTMSGIQRVQAGIAGHAIADPSINAHFILNRIDDAPFSLAAGEFWLLDNTLITALIDYASGSYVDHAALQAMLAHCEDAAERVRPSGDQTIVLLGAFWAVDNSVEQLVQPRRDGVRIGAYIYDLIPITHPEYCDANLVSDFTTAFSEVCFLADFMFTISEATRMAVEAFLVEHGGRSIPVTAVPLAHLLTGNIAAAPVWPKALAQLKGKPYVAYVSTVEGRKNHLYVVNAWRQLIADGVKVPDLVFVGRKGWRIGGLLDLLDATGNLDGRVHIVHDLSDGELNGIYANSLFTVFTSFVEGWGLPVGEALVHHRPCIASSTSSIPEVGGEFVDYVDPYNLRDGIAAFRRMITDHAYRRGREAAIRDRFVPRDWKDVARDFVVKVEQARIAERPPALPLALPMGMAFWIGDIAAKPTDVDAYLRLPYRLLVGSGDFYRAKPGGAWMRGDRGTFELHTALPAGSEVMLYLKIAAAAWSLGCALRITAAETDTRDDDTAIEVDCASLSVLDGVRLRAKVGREGLVPLLFTVLGDFTVPPGDPRYFAVGLRAIGYAPVADVAARQDLVESFSFRLSSS